MESQLLPVDGDEHLGWLLLTSEVVHGHALCIKDLVWFVILFIGLIGDSSAGTASPDEVCQLYALSAMLLLKKGGVFLPDALEHALALTNVFLTNVLLTDVLLAMWDQCDIC